MDKLNPDLWVRQAKAAEILDISPRTLEQLRCRGGGPRYSRFSARQIRYAVADLMAWAEARTRTSTSGGEAA